MNGPISLAMRYISYHKTKTWILISCIFLTAFLPIAIWIMLREFDQQIVSRADNTPSIVGAKGSRLDLALHALYFKRTELDSIPYGTMADVGRDELAKGIPIYSNFTASDRPIVGTSLDYFDFRGLKIQDGHPLTVIGDCVLGSRAASELNLKVGDTLLSDRENVLDIGGLYPLKMKVRGILAPSQTPDDGAVFVDLKTAWIIQGLGHGHQELANETDEGKILKRDDEKIVASAAVLPFTEITDQNIDSFHFHGNTTDFPITAIITVAPNTKSETLLQGRFDTDQPNSQMIQPGSVVRDLMNMIFKVEKFFYANAILIAVSTLMLLVLVILLSLRLRKREMETMFKIGCSRGTILQLQLFELGFVFLLSTILVAAAVWGTKMVAGDLVQSLLLGS